MSDSINQSIKIYIALLQDPYSEALPINENITIIIIFIVSIIVIVIVIIIIIIEYHLTGIRNSSKNISVDLHTGASILGGLGCCDPPDFGQRSWGHRGL